MYILGRSKYLILFKIRKHFQFLYYTNRKREWKYLKNRYATIIFEFMNDLEVDIKIGNKVHILHQILYSLLSIFFSTRKFLNIMYKIKWT